MEQRLLLLVCALVLFTTATAQVDDCELSDLLTGGSLEREMSRAITDSPEITVLRNHTVCLSVGPRRGKVSSISLVIEYTCSGSARCPSGRQGIEQFDFGCAPRGEWKADQFSDFDNGRTTNPTANFDTSLRTDCGACFPVHPAMTNPPTIDPVTHCHECRGCSDIGQMACYDSLASGCCNVYVNDMCADTCPDNTYVIDPNFVCVQICPDLGNTVSGGTVQYSQSLLQGGYPEGTTATVTCSEGYAGGGDITCQSESWSGSLPGCTIVDCGEPPSLENGVVRSQSGTTFGSVVTYECNENYQLADEDVNQRTCLASGSWSREDIRCEMEGTSASTMATTAGSTQTTSFYGNIIILVALSLLWRFA